MTNEEILQKAIVRAGFSNLELYEINPQYHNKIIDEIITLVRNEENNSLEKAKIFDIVKSKMLAIKANPKATFQEMGEVAFGYFT